MTNIANLYLQVFVPDNNIVARATSEILQIYQDPNSISQVVEILKSNPNPSIRSQAAIGLKTILQNFWHKYCQTTLAESIITEIFGILQKESVSQIQHSIIYALEPICSYREVVWSRKIDDFALNCICSNDQNILDIGLLLFEIIINYLDENTINQILTPLSEKIKLVLQTPNNLIQTSSNLISSLTKIFQPPIPECLSELIEHLFIVFKFFLTSQFPFIHVIANDLSEIVSREGVSASSHHLKYLLEVANDPSIPPTVIHHVFTPIAAIIKDKYMESAIYKLIPVLLSTVFKCAALAFKDDCITEQSDSIYIFDTLDSIPNYEEEDGIKLFAFFSQMMSNSSIQISFSSLLAFQFFIDNYPRIILDNLKQTITFLLQQANVSNHHCLCEQSMICIHHLINVVNGGLIAYTDPLLQAIISAVSVDHDELVIEGLTAMAELFKTFDFNHSLIPSILTLLTNKIRKSQEIMNGCAQAMNTLIFGSGSDISPFVTQLAPLFFNLFKMSEKNFPLLKSSAIESIAGLLKNAPNEMLPFLEDSMKMLIHQCQTSEDLLDLETSLSAFSIIADSQVPQITASMQMAMQKSVNVLQMQCPILQNNEDDENQADDTIPAEYKAKQTAMNFINSFVKAHPEVFPPFVQPCTELLVSHIRSCYEQRTRIAAIKTLTSFAKMKLINPVIVTNEFLQLYNMNDDDPTVTSTFFSSIGKILVPEVPPEIVTNCVKIAIKGLKNRMNYQESENIDIYAFEYSIFKFLSKVAQTHTNLYPINMLLKIYVNRSKRTDSADSISLIILSFSNFLIAVKKAGVDINQIIPAQIQQLILRSILRSLSICNGTVAPFPLLAVKNCYKEGIFQINASFLDPTFQAINSICSIENNGQPTYNETMAAVVSLLYILFLMMGPSFNVATYINLMVSSLPIRFKRYADDVYTSLIQLFQKYPQVLGQFTSQVIVGIAKTLALPDNSLNAAGLSLELVGQLATFLKALMGNIPNSTQIIQEAIQNQSELARVTQRMSQ